jgi:PIN domain nuclease of toxin-antitoxin system
MNFFSHRDPFDRILIAQSQLEKMPLMTSDSQIGKYDVDVIW